MNANRPFAVDITNCDREPIHSLGSIQPFGFMLALNSHWEIERASQNVQDFTGIRAEVLFGKPISDVLLDEAVHTIRNRMLMLRGPDAVERIFSLKLRKDRPPFDIAVHMSGRSIIIEAEPAVGDEIEAATLVRTMASRQSQTESIPAFLREGARQVRALCGFDRVMVYRFDPSGSGEVAAESLRSGTDSFLGLNYPASDIPAQARALYVRNIFRVIHDVNASAVPIHPALDKEGGMLDQSMSVLRAVSPIHIEYLKNMGVRASLSISIVIEGKLWGLFACHHYEPRLPTFAQRTAAELFGQMFSMMLESRLRREAAAYETRARMAADRLMTSLAQDNQLLNNVQYLGDIILDTIPADGVGVAMNGSTAFSGLTPDHHQFEQIAEMLSRQTPGKVFTTDNIASLVPEAAEYAHKSAGLLAIPLSRSPRDYVVLFRSERLRSVRWAGNVEKEIEYGPNGPRLTPRKSFEEWQELVKGTAAPFNHAELRIAETLRIALMEVVLRLADEVDRERQRAHEQQELLIAELNHRVRNILALIRGLISQTRNSALSAEAFINTLDQRVQALARAHDQITADKWGPASLIDLIETESGAFLGGKSDRVLLEGPSVLVEPSAFTVLALVFHELITNAAKYGALSDSGTVKIKWHLDHDGSLLLSWRETGGPAVVAPTRRGFGSTIIERSIPYDLGGKAEVQYRISGLEADLCVPSRHVAGIAAKSEQKGMRHERSVASHQPLDGKKILLVEDSMLIALDAEQALSALGAATVRTASTTSRAIAFALEEKFDFAVLDFNLGGETSVPIAEVLRKKGIPFIFATGYGDGLDLPEHLRDIELLSKPYNMNNLAAVFARKNAV